MKLLDNAGALAVTLFHMIDTRLELFGLEVRQERQRLVWAVGLVTLACGSFLLSGVGLFLILALALSPADRLLVLSLCVGALILVCMASIGFAIYLVHSTELPFRETRDVLNKDAECLTSMLKKRKSQP